MNENEYKDEVLRCRNQFEDGTECGKKFIFTEGEQEFYQEKGFDTPKRCNECREQRKKEKRERGEY